VPTRTARHVDTLEAPMSMVLSDPLLSADIAAGTRSATKIYGRGENAVRALDEVTIGFRRARLTAIMGPSGSGKSTLMHCVAGLDSLTSGHAYIGDTDLGSLKEQELTRVRRDRIGFVFQAYNLVPTLTAMENITLPAKLAGRSTDAQLLDQVIEAVGLRTRLHHRPSELSGGQQQRVAVARALAGRPDIIFADEPTGNLDSRAGAEILAFMRNAVDDLGQTIVMVTHDPVAACTADVIVFLSDGRIVDQMEEPTVERILDHMKTLGG
jgi:putative ABC transport system ATP-binding protein